MLEFRELEPLEKIGWLAEMFSHFAVPRIVYALQQCLLQRCCEPAFVVSPRLIISPDAPETPPPRPPKRP
jgi:hypothetical protein